MAHSSTLNHRAPPPPKSLGHQMVPFRLPFSQMDSSHLQLILIHPRTHAQRYVFIFMIQFAPQMVSFIPMNALLEKWTAGKLRSNSNFWLIERDSEACHVPKSQDCEITHESSFPYAFAGRKSNWWIEAFVSARIVVSTVLDTHKLPFPLNRWGRSHVDYISQFGRGAKAWGLSFVLPQFLQACLRLGWPDIHEPMLHGKIDLRVRNTCTILVFSILMR